MRNIPQRRLHAFRTLALDVGSVDAGEQENTEWMSTQIMNPKSICQNCARPLLGNVVNPSNWRHLFNDSPSCGTKGGGTSASPGEILPGM